MARPLKASLLLSRIPVVTPEPSAFAAAYYKYMSELERRLMWTFPSWFYFKRGTLAQRKFNDVQRGPVPRNKNTYFPAGLPDIKHNRDRRFKQDVTIVPDEQERVKPAPRQTASEEDATSLARKLDKTLYLVVKQKSWRLPAFDVADDAHSLHEAAEAGLRELGGEFMNVWTVSSKPAAVVHDGPTPEFLIKSHILHGQFQPQSAATQFAWLTKQEIEKTVDKNYFEQIKDLL